MIPCSANRQVYDFLEGRSTAGRRYQRVTVVLIGLNVLTFVLSTVFHPKYNPDGPYQLCAADRCRGLDRWFFGNDDDNGLLGTSVFEILTVAVFTVDYFARLATAPEADAAYAGACGRLRFAVSFYALVDLVSTLPFYLDFFIEGNLPASQAIRMLRLARMMRLEGRYVESFTLLDELHEELSRGGLLRTAAFVGTVIWTICSSLYYLAERRNPKMIYCAACPDVDTGACSFDEWGLVDCSEAGCAAKEGDEGGPPCSSLFESIPSALFLTLLNLFGEFPLVQQHSPAGKLLATLVALVAVAFFAIPASIVGNGFQVVLEKRKAADGETGVRASIDNLTHLVSEAENERASVRHLESRHLVTERDRFLDERHLHMDVHAPPPRAEVGVARAFAAQLGEALPLLSVAGFGALLVWVAFATGMYFAERGSLDAEMAGSYKTIPDAMWLTLLNLSGESPLCHYSTAGKLLAALMAIVATGLFGIPIGLVGASFQQLVEGRTKDASAAAADATPLDAPPPLYAAIHAALSSGAALRVIFGVIFLSVGLAILETLPEYECDGAAAATTECSLFAAAEWASVLLFTVEYLLRLLSAPADPDLGGGGRARLRFVFSFYSAVDLLAVIPFYIAQAAPGGWVDEHDAYFRMLRLLRLLKLDKYVPSITLIDDVVRLKRQPLLLAAGASLALWLLFSSLLWLCEHADTANELDDPLPSYGCIEDCTMADRFGSWGGASFYTLIHLTGDYPIVTYSAAGRVTCFLMVVAAVGVVSVPSGLIASGFQQVVDERHETGESGDGYFETAYAALEGLPPPRSRWGPKVDALQEQVNTFLNGDGSLRRSAASGAFRSGILVLILANLVAVAAETVPQVDRWVGNEPHNFFDVLEAVSCFVFSGEYCARIFSAAKDKRHLYSPVYYATTFFGIVDLLSFLPWYVQQASLALGLAGSSSDAAAVFRIFRLFRVLQLERFLTAFTLLDNVLRASADVLVATGLMALIIWVGGAALFFLFEQHNPNYRECDGLSPAECYSFPSTTACNTAHPGSCSQETFAHMPDALYMTAIFLCGEWGVCDFTLGGRAVAAFMCIAGIAIAAIPIGSLFEAFGAVIGLSEEGDG